MVFCHVWSKICHCTSHWTHLPTSTHGGSRIMLWDGFLEHEKGSWRVDGARYRTFTPTLDWSECSSSRRYKQPNLWRNYLDKRFEGSTKINVLNEVLIFVVVMWQNVERAQVRMLLQTFLWRLLQSQKPFVLVCSEAVWDYLWIAQIEITKDTNMSSRERKEEVKAKQRPMSPSSLHPSPRRERNTSGGILLAVTFVEFNF